jgi:hypothetical protein
LKSTDEQHAFVVKALTAALKKCEKNGIPAGIAVQTVLSVGTTMLLSTCTESEAAKMLEDMAAVIRSGKMKKDDPAQE